MNQRSYTLGHSISAHFGFLTPYSNTVLGTPSEQWILKKKSQWLYGVINTENNPVLFKLHPSERIFLKFIFYFPKDSYFRLFYLTYIKSFHSPLFSILKKIQLTLKCWKILKEFYLLIKTSSFCLMVKHRNWNTPSSLPWYRQYGSLSIISTMAFNADPGINFTFFNNSCNWFTN